MISKSTIESVSDARGYSGPPCPPNVLTISRKRRRPNLSVGKTEARRLAAASSCWAASLASVYQKFEAVCTSVEKFSRAPCVGGCPLRRHTSAAQSDCNEDGRDTLWTNGPNKRLHHRF